MAGVVGLVWFACMMSHHVVACAFVARAGSHACRASSTRHYQEKSRLRGGILADEMGMG